MISVGLGRRVAEYAAHKDETDANKKRLKQLIERWCRFIFGKEASANYKGLAEAEVLICRIKSFSAVDRI